MSVDNLMTAQEAARHLQCCARTVARYASDGLLTKVKYGRRIMYRPLEVEELRRDRTSHTPRTRGSRKEILELRAQVRKLQAEMEVVLRILDARVTPLNLTATTARQLHESAAQTLGRTSFSLEELEAWAEIFMSLTEESFHIMAEAVEDGRACVLLMKLCIAQVAHVATREDYETSLRVQKVHRTLVEGRRRLRVSALCYTEMYGVIRDPHLQPPTNTPRSIHDELTGMMGRFQRTA